jgi:beta-aspartyl-peptidase (threonine type)
MFAIAIHGGAGTLTKSMMSADKEQQYLSALQLATEAGKRVLENNGSALDAVEAAVVELENCPLFNAGKGAVFNHIGEHELDASIMFGKNTAAGAVAGVRHISNPISLAKAVLQKSNHVMLMGDGAEQFAKEQNFELVDQSYFYNEFRYQQWQQIKNEDKFMLDHSVAIEEKKKGTVGAVALDKFGNLAAATSTGGMTNKKWGRVGDTPIIGAGTYANNSTCAVSCTGHGEFFIEQVVAYDVHCLMLYKNLTLKEATEFVVLDKLKKIEAEGGLISLDKDGNISLVFNSEGMYRASFRDGDSKISSNIY